MEWPGRFGDHHPHRLTPTGPRSLAPGISDENAPYIGPYLSEIPWDGDTQRRCSRLSGIACLISGPTGSPAPVMAGPMRYTPSADRSEQRRWALADVTAERDLPKESALFQPNSSPMATELT